MLSKLHEKFEVIDRNHVLNRETNVVTKNRQIVELLTNTGIPSISTQQIVYKAKSNKRYRNIIGGAARPRKEIPNTNVIDALQILADNLGRLDWVDIIMRNNEEVVLGIPICCSTKWYGIKTCK